MTLHTCYLNTREQRQEDPQAHWQPAFAQSESSRLKKRPCLRNQGRQFLRKDSQRSLAMVCSFIPTHTGAPHEPTHIKKLHIQRSKTFQSVHSNLIPQRPEDVGDCSADSQEQWAYLQSLKLSVSGVNLLPVRQK